MKTLPVCFALVVLLVPHAFAQFTRVVGREFYIKNSPFYYLGANYWQAMNLSEGQMVYNLEELAKRKISSIRIMGTSQGPLQPYRMWPAIEPYKSSPFSEQLLNNLDLFFNKTREYDNVDKNNMKVVVVVNNFWHWTGGLAQYVRWYCNNSAIPYPIDNRGNETFVEYVEQFYSCKAAKEAFKNTFAELANHKNKYTGVLYKDDPTIMAWEIAHDAMPGAKTTAFKGWIQEIAEFIKSVDPNHLVTVGSSGSMHDPSFRAIHEIDAVDYITFHLLPERWAWYMPNDLNYTKVRTEEYIASTLSTARVVRKPLVLDAFIYPRDEHSPYPNSTTEFRDEYYRFVLESMYKLAKEKLVGGTYFWGWSGRTFPIKPGTIWNYHDNMIGDTPNVKQGLYSVYYNDTTMGVIAEYASKMQDLPEKEQVPGYVWVVFLAVIGGFVALIAIFIIVACRTIPEKKRKVEKVKLVEEEEKLVTNKLKDY